MKLQDEIGYGPMMPCKQSKPGYAVTNPFNKVSARQPNNPQVKAIYKYNYESCPSNLEALIPYPTFIIFKEAKN